MMNLTILITILLSFGSPADQNLQLAPFQSYADSVSNWKGYTRYHFRLHEREAFITAPHSSLENKEWVWRARFPEWHTEMDEILLEAGFHIAYINTDHMFGSPGAMDIWDEFYKHMVDELGFAEKASLEGVSRGGLFVFNWAKRNPWKVHAIYTEAPVCDFKSWPGGYGSAVGDREAWDRLKEAYGFENDQEAIAYRDNPLDNLEGLGLARVPVLAMIGLNDRVVPPSENMFILSDRYVQAGGPITLIPCTGDKEELMGHHFTIETPEQGAAFIISSTLRPSLTLSSRIFHQDGQGLANSLTKFETEETGTVAFLGGSITQNGGWRDSICGYLQERFPRTEFTFIPAGIASMGTTPGAFRLVRDVLSRGPVDLLFVEAAVNDATNGRSREEQVRGMEGIVRHTLLENPATDIVIMHFADPDKMKSYNGGVVPEVIQNYDLVAGHYRLGTINLALEVTQRINNAEFSWEKDFIDLHPSPFGQSVYFHSMKSFLESQFTRAEQGNRKIENHPIPEALDPWCYERGKIVSFTGASEVSGFEAVKNWTPAIEGGTRKGYTQVDMLVGREPGDRLSLQFEGRAVGIMVAAGPDAGMIEFRIDKGEWQSLDLFTAWSSQLYLPWYYTLAAELEPGPHTLELRIGKEKNKNSLGYSCILKSFYVNE
jgi:sialidase-1